MIKKNGTHQKTATDASIASMASPPSSSPAPATVVTPDTPADPNSGFHYENTRVYFERHRQATAKLEEMQASLRPVVEKLQAKYPDALPQLAEVLEGCQQRVRDAYEAGKKKERLRHGGR